MVKADAWFVKYIHDPIGPEPICVAGLILWASPPDSVYDDLASVR